VKFGQGYRIRHAARYHSRLTIAERVQVLDAGRWRPADATELAEGADDGVAAAREVSVIAIPRHLLRRWWDLAESRDGDLAGISPGFERYAREVAEYFNYKRWELPARAVLEVVAAASDGDAAALQPSRPTHFRGGVGMLIACINLGDDKLAIVLGAESAQIRVMLEPGEGVMLPASGILWNRSAPAEGELAITLLIGLLD
jgi:hypothetical protein